MQKENNPCHVFIDEERILHAVAVSKKDKYCPYVIVQSGFQTLFQDIFSSHNPELSGFRLTAII